MAFERHMYLAPGSFARLSLITEHKKQRRSVSCYKLPTVSEPVSEVALFQGSTPFSGDSPRGGPRALDTGLKIWGAPWMRGLGPAPGPSELRLLPFAVQTTVSWICYWGKRKRDKGESASPMPGYQYSFRSSLLNAAQLLKPRLTPVASPTVPRGGASWSASQHVWKAVSEGWRFPPNIASLALSCPQRARTQRR